CGVSSFSNSALFKLRERRFSVRIRVIFSCSEREMLLSFTSRLDWMPNSISDTNPASGFVRRSQSSEENFVNCALSLDRILLSCTGGRLRGGSHFSQKPFYHGFRPLPLSNPGKLLIFQWLGFRPFRFWGNSCKDLSQIGELLRGGIQQVRVVLRALSLRQLADGFTAPQAAQALPLTAKAVRQIAHRYTSDGLGAAVYSKQRPGAQEGLDGPQKQRIVAMVCSKPPEGGGRWTVRLIAEEAVKRKLV